MDFNPRFEHAPIALLVVPMAAGIFFFPPSTLPSMSDHAVASLPTKNGEPVVEKLLASKNPALARLASSVQTRDDAGQPENYSRMHHRHNRS